MLNENLKYLILCVLLFSSSVFASEKTSAEQGEKGIEEFRRGNLIQAMTLLNKSAASGYTPAQTTLAYILDQAEENDRAFKLFKQAAEKNNSAAQFGLGNMYAKGEGTDKDTVVAGQWIKKSALQLHAPAMRAYAYALESGNLGFKKNTQQALHWYMKCNQAADVICTRRLFKIYSDGELGQAVNLQKASEFKHRLEQPLVDKKINQEEKK